MSLLNKLLSLFKKPSTNTRPDAAGEMIKVYDKFGRELLIEKAEWRTNILPQQIEKDWDDPDALYGTIVTALDDGLFEDVLAASERLVSIGPDKTTSYAVRSIVLMKTNDLDGAEELLNSYLKQFGTNGVILVNLAKVHAERGNQQKAEEVLWQALNADPNQDNGLMWWGAIQHERGGGDAFYDAMRQVAAIEGSWRPQLWLARMHLEQHDLPKAMQLYDGVLNDSPLWGDSQHLKASSEQSDALTMISGDLGNNGHCKELLRLVEPLYDPKQHHFGVGMNILQSYVELGDKVSGEAVLHQLFALQRPDIEEHLMHYSREFDKLTVADIKPDTDPDQLEFGVIHFTKPIWASGLGDPQWLIPPDDGRDKVVFVPLANITKSDVKEVKQQQENDIGRLTRTIPLFLGESLYFRSNIRPQVAIPIVMGGGPVVSGAKWAVEHLRHFAEGNSDLVVSGTVEQSGDGYLFSLSVYDTAEEKLLKTFDYTSLGQQTGHVLFEMSQDLEKFFGSATRPDESYYVMPDPKLIDPYAICFGQALIMTLIHEEYVSQDGLWGERNMFQCFLRLSLEMAAAQTPKLMFLAAFVKSRGYGSQVYEDFQRKLLSLLEDEQPGTPFYKCSPLVFKTFGMHDEFERRVAELRQINDPLYLEWLDDVANE